MNRSWSLMFGERPERIAHGRSCLVRDLSHLLTSLIFGEQPERIAHGSSCLVSDLSDLLTSLIFGR